MTYDKFRVHDKCICVSENSNLQMGLIPLAIQRNKYFRSQEAGFDVGVQAAEEDFYNNHFQDWGNRCRLALCAICQDSSHCTVGQRHFDDFFDSISRLEEKAETSQTYAMEAERVA